MKSFIFTRPNAPEVAELLEELSQVLTKITGDSGQGSFSTNEFNPEEDAFLVVSVDNKPLACGGLRKVTAHVCELKRMYSRVRGLGSDVLSSLEAKAKELGYGNIILSTRRVNTDAINFYIKQGYEEIQPYGKYKNSEVSACFGKEL